MPSTDLVVWRLRPTSGDDPFPFQVTSNRSLNQVEFTKVVAWCHSTFGAGLYGWDTASNQDQARWLASIWVTHEGEATITTIFRFRTKKNCAAFVLAWTGEIL